MLRGGYAAFGLAYVALAASVLVQAALPAGLVLVLVGAILLSLSQDDLPKWSGLALVGYYVVTLLAFVASTPITINKGGRYFVNDAPPELANALFSYLVLALPLMLGAATLAAAWEREWPPRLLLCGSIGGFLLVGILSIFLLPNGEDVTEAAQSAKLQADLIQTLFAVSAAAGAVGALWAATRPDEYA